jgi:hypothetical protein
MDDVSKNKGDDSYSLKSGLRKMNHDEPTELKFVELGDSSGLYAQPTFANFLDTKTPPGTGFNNYLSYRDNSLNNRPTSPSYGNALKLSKIHCENLRNMNTSGFNSVGPKSSTVNSKNLFLHLNSGDSILGPKSNTPHKEISKELIKEKFDENSTSPSIYQKKLLKMQGSKNSSLFHCPCSPIK